MVPLQTNLVVSPRHKDMLHGKDGEVPQILAGAWSVNYPGDRPIVDQLNAEEKTFLILFAEYIVSALDSPLSASDPSTVLSDILMTARHRFSLLSKEISLSPHHIVIVTLLQLLTNLYSSDNMKYTTLDSFLEVYSVFKDRSTSEKEKLFHTANWMHVLFQITTAKKNKGMVMDIIPKFVEGNGVQYVTGSGQTQPTKDRVTIYEIEGNVTPVKRQHRKSKKELLLEASEPSSRPSNATRKKATHVKSKRIITRADEGPIVVRAGVRNSHSPLVKLPSHIVTENEGSEMEQEGQQEEQKNTQQQTGYLPLPFSFTMMAPPIPVRRTQSSFSKAAAEIAGNSMADQQDTVDNYSSDTANCRMSSPTSSYVYSPRECYLDVEADGKMRKVSSATWGMSNSISSSSLSCMSPRQQHNSDYQLQMLREVSEDSDFTTEDAQATDSNVGEMMGANLLPPYLLHQQSLTLSLPSSTATSGNAVPSIGSPNPQPRTLERCPTGSLDEDGEIDYELIDVSLSRQPSFSWLSRSTSATSLSGRDSVLTNA